jgi:hypothetical protein
MIEQYVLDLQDIDEMQVAAVGGKAAHLARLSRIEGIRVPPGFCVTTDAFRIMAEASSIDDRLDQLSRLNTDDREAIRELSAAIRRTIEGMPIWRRRSPGRSPRLAIEPPAPCDPVRRQRTCRRHPLPASRTRT